MDIIQNAQMVYTALWIRNATKMGWSQHCRWSKTLEWHLKTRDRKILRKVFSQLLNQGYFLSLRVADGHHPHYLFVPEPILDPEMKEKAIKYWRWSQNYSKGWQPDWLTKLDLTAGRAGGSGELSSPALESNTP